MYNIYKQKYFRRKFELETNKIFPKNINLFNHFINDTMKINTIVNTIVSYYAIISIGRLFATMIMPIIKLLFIE